jgi:hypothetical protein
MAAVNFVHHNKKSVGQLGEWGSEANEWSLRASVDHSLAHVLCAPFKESLACHDRTYQFCFAPSIPFICVDLILRLPPPTCCLSLFFTVDLSSSLLVAQSTAGLLTANGPLFEGVKTASRRLCAGAFEPIVVPEPQYPFRTLMIMTIIP